MGFSGAVFHEATGEDVDGVVDAAAADVFEVVDAAHGCCGWWVGRVAVRRTC